MKSDLIPVTIDLGPIADRITINDVEYYNGITYRMDAGRAAVVNEQMARSWSHEREIHGMKDLPYRREVNEVLRGGAFAVA